MAKQRLLSNSAIVYYRLIAFWALNEAMLGGIIHGLKIPVSGLVVGGGAVLCICLIAWYVPKKGAIIKATIVVAIFKMMLSPQAPIFAYLAVFFQGFLGECLFWNRRFFRISCMLLAILTMLESAFQRILVLTLYYGNDFWKAVNDFFNGLTGQKNSFNYSLLIGGGYVILHFITGCLVGWWASRLPHGIDKWKSDPANKVVITSPQTITFERRRRKTRLKTSLFIVWILLILLYLQSYLKIGKPLLPSQVALEIFLRSIVIVLSWVFIVSPILTRLLYSWLQKKKSKSREEIAEVLQLLPSTQQLVKQSWQQAGEKKGIKRMIRTVELTLANGLFAEMDPNAEIAPIYILTGPIQSGKTTSLMTWSKNRKDISGILTPVVNGKRMFMDAGSRYQFAMEAEKGEKDILPIGRFVFSKKAFDWAVQIVRDGSGNDGWLVIDEIGPLELQGKGFFDVLRRVLGERQRQKLLLVVREDLAEKVKEHFGLSGAVVIRSVSNSAVDI